MGCRQRGLLLVTEMSDSAFMKQVNGCQSRSAPAAAWFDS